MKHLRIKLLCRARSLCFLSKQEEQNIDICHLNVTQLCPKTCFVNTQETISVIL